MRYVGESPRQAKVREVRDVVGVWLIVVSIAVGIAWLYVEAAS
jgi:hypothetical protein